MSIKALRDQKAALVSEAEELASTDANGELSDEELARYEALIAADTGEIAKINAKIVRQEAVLEERRQLASQAIGDTARGDPAPAKVPPQPVNNEQFGNFGEQLQAIAYAGMNKGSDPDRRLKWGAATGAGEAVPSEGGFLVQKDFSIDLLGLMHEMGDLLGRVRRVPLGANSNGIKLPVIKETSRANGSRWGGVQGYWVNEADTATASRPTFDQIELSLQKLLAIGYSTEELLRDSSALEMVMRTAFSEEMTFKTEDAIINGTGSGQPLGILNSGALISQAAESGQAAATVNAQNVLNMYSRMPARQRRNAVWLINQEIEPQLWTMALPNATGAMILLYRPPGSNDASGVSSFATLLGRPVLPVEYCAALGTVGDILFFDPQSYVMIDKDGVRSDSSMHVRFLYDEMTFRFIYRVDGQPIWRTTLSPFKGTNSYSPYVGLATRA